MKIKSNHNQLVERLKDSDAEAFDELFDRYSRQLYFFAFKYLKSDTEAEELVQETFLRVWENRRSLLPDSSFKSYLFTIALNQMRKAFRKRTLLLRYLTEHSHHPAQADTRDIDSVDYASLLARLDHLIEKLPARKRTIFIMSRKEGRSSKEIARELEITSGAVDNQISDALKIIRYQMKNEFLFMALFLLSVFY